MKPDLSNADRDLLQSKITDLHQATDYDNEALRDLLEIVEGASNEFVSGLISAIFCDVSNKEANATTRDQLFLYISKNTSWSPAIVINLCTSLSRLGMSDQWIASKKEQAFISQFILHAVEIPVDNKADHFWALFDFMQLYLRDTDQKIEKLFNQSQHATFLKKVTQYKTQTTNQMSVQALDDLLGLT